MEEIPFSGFMPLSKLLDWLHEEFDRKGDVWVQIKGTIRETDIAVVHPDGTAELPQNRP
jgi:hypothetical protein